MKNIIIVFLIMAVGVLGYFQFIKDDSHVANLNKTNDSYSSTEPDKYLDDNKETIDLSNKNLTEVPKDILDNNKVVILDVSNNRLTGALPAEIRMLSSLESLIASDNNLTGIPAEIGQLSRLRVANFVNNNISGLPNEIGNLKNLETLDLRGNPNVSDQDLAQIRSKIPNTDILTD